MADDARQSLPDLADTAQPTAAYDFFELLRCLERDGKLLGHPGRPDQEPARLGQHVRLSFATQDVAEYTPADGNQPARVTVANIGLLGPEGPLPLHITRWVLDRLSQRWFADPNARGTSDTTFLDFVNAIQHRLIALYYRAWAEAHPGVQVERRAGGRVTAMLRALSGIGLPGTSDRDSGLDLVRLRQAAALGHQVEGPERLTLFLSEALDVPVHLQEFLPSWMEVPAHLQTRINGRHAALGRSAGMGPRIFQRQSRVELRIGPVDLKTFTELLPGQEKLKVLKKAVRELVGGVLDVDLRVVLAREEVPAAALGQSRLARTGWLAPPRDMGDAGDMLIRTLVGRRQEEEERLAA
jgi:type VI secretion system protein ImpH